jgi:hypothetical protein
MAPDGCGQRPLESTQKGAYKNSKKDPGFVKQHVKNNRGSNRAILYKISRYRSRRAVSCNPPIPSITPSIRSHPPFIGAIRPAVLAFFSKHANLPPLTCHHPQPRSQFPFSLCRPPSTVDRQMICDHLEALPSLWPNPLTQAAHRRYRSPSSSHSLRLHMPQTPWVDRI